MRGRLLLGSKHKALSLAVVLRSEKLLHSLILCHGRPTVHRGALDASVVALLFEHNYMPLATHWRHWDLLRMPRVLGRKLLAL